MTTTKIVAKPATPPPPAADAGPADRRPVSAFYRSIMAEIDAQRMRLGLSQQEFSDCVGHADRLYAKYLHVDAPRSGREASFKALDEMLAIAFAGGYDLKIVPANKAPLSASKLADKITRNAALNNRLTLRHLMSKLGKIGGRKGGLARAAKLPGWRRRQIARKAARMRNQQLSSEQRKESAAKAAHARWSRSEPEERGR